MVELDDCTNECVRTVVVDLEGLKDSEVALHCEKNSEFDERGSV